MAEIFAIGFLENMKVFFVAILMYVLIFALLKTVKPLGDDPKINSLIALLAAIIVSFSGVVTYAVAYAVNWFFIIFFVIFLFLMIIMFLGVKPDQIASGASKNAKIILGIFVVLFLVIIMKSFFALNNTFDNNEPINDSYAIDTSYNTGVDDITNKEIDSSFWDRFNVDPDLLSAALFLMAMGIFVFIIGR